MPHGFAHFLISAGIGIAAFVATGWFAACFAGAAFYAAREVWQWDSGKRYKGGFDWPGLIGGVLGAAPAVAVWQWWPLLFVL